MRIRLGISMNVYEITSATSAVTAISGKTIIEYITTNSQEAKPGDLFIALVGNCDSGENYVNDAIKRGAFALTTTNGDYRITVKDTSDALLTLASYYKTKLKNLKYTVAITGSVGKTTVKEFTRVICSAKYKTHATAGNLNNKIGVPLTILSAAADTELLILEMGMNTRGEISTLSKCGKPNLAIITNIGTAHIGNLGSRDEIAKAKLEILDGLENGKLIIPSDEPLLKNERCDFCFSISDSSADLTVRRDKEKAELVYIQLNNKLVKCSFKTPGEQNLICLAAAASVATQLELSDSELKSGVSSISNKNTRQNIIPCKNFYILSDYYNASYESVISAADMISTLSEYSYRSALIGSILELGKYAEEVHYKLGFYLSKYGFHNLYFIGEYSEALSKGAIDGGFENSRIFKNNLSNEPMKTANDILNNTTDREIILFKASRAIKLERVYEILKDL